MDKKYNYINGLSKLKVLVIHDSCGDKIEYSILDGYTGEVTGQGEMTKNKLKEFLEHYKIKEQ